MIELTLNDLRLESDSVEALDASLKGVMAEPKFELWASVQSGPAMSMLRHDTDSWLMYLRWPGDAGFRSVGTERSGVASYSLSNGQVDEFPRSWCIDIESCLEAFRDFHRRNGARPESITWAAC